MNRRMFREALPQVTRLAHAIGLDLPGDRRPAWMASMIAGRTAKQFQSRHGPQHQRPIHAGEKPQARPQAAFRPRHFQRAVQYDRARVWLGDKFRRLLLGLNA